MNYKTVCKPGNVFYGRLKPEGKKIYKFKVLSIVIYEDETIDYNCSIVGSEEDSDSSIWHLTEEDFKNLMFKTRKAAQKDFEARTKLYEALDDYKEELRFEANLNLARKLIENNEKDITVLQGLGIFSEEEYSYVMDLFQEQYQYFYS